MPYPPPPPPSGRRRRRRRRDEATINCSRVNPSFFFFGPVFVGVVTAHVRSRSQDDGRGTHTAAVQTTTSPKAAKTGCQETSFQYLLVLGATFVPVVHVFMYIQSNTRSSNVRVHQNKTNKHINNVETRLLQCYNQVQYQLHSKRQSMPGDRNIFI